MGSNLTGIKNVDVSLYFIYWKWDQNSINCLLLKNKFINREENNSNTEFILSFMVHINNLFKLFLWIISCMIIF